jgi:hypothetical protein
MQRLERFQKDAAGLWLSSFICVAERAAWKAGTARTECSPDPMRPF